jgi:hypothetical protein
MDDGSWLDIIIVVSFIPLTNLNSITCTYPRMRCCNFTSLRWLQVVIALWTAASSSAVRSEFSFAGMLTTADNNDYSNNDANIDTDNDTDASTYAVPDATAELLASLFLPAVTFDAVIAADKDEEAANLDIESEVTGTDGLPDAGARQ